LDGFKKNIENADFYFIFPSLSQKVKEIKNGLDAEIINPSARTIRIRHQHTNSIFSKDICNSLVDVYFEHDIDRKLKSSEKIVKFISGRKDSIQKKLIFNEKKIRSFKIQNDFENRNSLFDAKRKKYEQIEKKLIEINSDIDLLSQFDLMFSVNLSSQITSSSIKNISLLTIIFYEDNLIKTMINQLQEDVFKRDLLLKDITENNKNIIQLNRQIEEEILYIKKAVKLLKESYKKRKLKINNTKSQLRSIEEIIPEKELELMKLNVIIKINNEYYTQLLKKETEHELNKAGVITYNEILKRAQVNEIPISPNKNLIYLISIISGIVVCLVFVLINYIRHDKITSLHEIHKYSNIEIPTLGFIPFVKDKMEVSQLIVDKRPKSMLTESFRAIRTNLQFINNDTDSKVIAVSSTVSGEGKTFIAINLGGIIAFTGKKVIIVDLDMRKPKIHLALGSKNENGMSEILSKKSKIEDCIKTSSLENLDFITAGTLPPNPSELIINETFDKSLEQLKKNYDIIIIDNPPVGLVTDGIPVLQKADYPIYVFKANYSRKTFVQNVEKLIKENKLNKLSIVLNGVDSKRNEYTNKYGYGYGYGINYLARKETRQTTSIYANQ
jgi:capsular exopolysaccharide synthesis family protein